MEHVHPMESLQMEKCIKEASFMYPVPLHFCKSSFSMMIQIIEKQRVCISG